MPNECDVQLMHFMEGKGKERSERGATECNEQFCVHSSKNMTSNIRHHCLAQLLQNGNTVDLKCNYPFRLGCFS